MDDVERALSEIADIRARVTASSRFRGFAPESMISGSLFSLAIAMAQTLWPEALARDGSRYVAVWGATLACASVVAAIEAVARCRSLHGVMADAMLSAALRQLLPFGAAAVVIALVICRAAPSAAWLAPGLWLMLIGLAGFSLAASLPRAILWPSTWYFFCGAVVLGLAARDGTLSPWAMGLSFAVGQAWVAIVLARGGGATHGPA